MILPDVISATTTAPARALRRPDLGTLKPGAIGDASILSLESLPTDLEDVLGQIIPYPQRLTAQGRVIAGVWTP